MYNKLIGYLCRDGLESIGFGLSYLHLGIVPVLFVSFCLICHPYMSVILEQNVFILVCVLLCYVRYVYYIPAAILSHYHPYIKVTNVSIENDLFLYGVYTIHECQISCVYQVHGLSN